MANNIISFLPNPILYETMLSFIRNPTLRKNIAISYRYSVFLIGLEEENELPGAISYSVFKNIIVNLAMIVECALHYCLKEFLDNNIIKSTDIMPWEWASENTTVLHEILNEENLNEQKRVCGVTQRKKYKQYNKRTDFAIVNEIAYKQKILTKTLFKKADSLRIKRNKIHLASLENIDNAYEKRDVIKATKDTAAILLRVKKQLEKINNLK